MGYLVVSHEHGLIPFAYRLKLQGYKTELVVSSERFEHSWEGKFDHILPAKEVNKENLGPSLELAKAGNVTVLSDNRKTSSMFEGVESFFGVTEIEEYPKPQSIVRLGGWFDGEAFQNPHLLICDVGVWPGGYGPVQLGGLTLIRLDAENHNLFHEFIAPVRDLLLEKYKFQGLVQAGLQEDSSGRPEVQGVQCGWPFLQSHAFLSELENFAGLLDHETVELPRKIVTVVPVSVPPWPMIVYRGPPIPEREVGGLTPKQMSKVFWHDVQLDSVKRKVRSGGLDGLLGVTRGAADTPDLARSRSLAIALTIQVPEKQVRPDAGCLVAQTIAEFEGKLGVVL
jgi:hypothetical protein